MLVKRAEEFAKLVHRNQSYGELLYYVHLKEVVLTIKELGITQDEILLASAWLHDSLEHTETTYETLKIQFGKSVADIVFAVTNEKGTNRKEIFKKTAIKIKDNEKALLIKLVDRVVNTEQSLNNNERLYKMYKKEFPLFRELLYEEKSITYPIIYLWYYLENLYRDEVDRLNVEEIESIALDIYSNNLDEREAEYYSALEKREILDEWAMQMIEYQEELGQVERERKEDKYWDSYYSIVEGG